MIVVNQAGMSNINSLRTFQNYPSTRPHQKSLERFNNEGSGFARSLLAHHLKSVDFIEETPWEPIFSNPYGQHYHYMRCIVVHVSEISKNFKEISVTSFLLIQCQ